MNQVRISPAIDLSAVSRAGIRAVPPSKRSATSAAFTGNRTPRAAGLRQPEQRIDVVELGREPQLHALAELLATGPG